MSSFKGILKYLIYTAIAGWMFLLGIMVGRGTSPVTFDTQKFQKRLEAIAHEFGEKKGGREKIDLTFYDVLESPVPEQEDILKEDTPEIFPKQETRVAQGPVSLKTSRKKLTFRGKGQETGVEIKTAGSVKAKESTVSETSAPSLEKKNKSLKQAPAVAENKQEGKYTIQVAAYQKFTDAVAHMAALEKKGFSSYRVKAKKDGITWYRVRIGSFAGYDAAKKYLETLNKAKIRAMIIKRESNEDING
jgi:cell division protein FtsN